MNGLAFLAGVTLLAGIQQTPRTPQSVAQPIASLHPEPAMELLLLDVVSHNLRLETALPAYQDSSGHRFIPLRQMCFTMGFRVRVYAARRYASGFLTTPTDTFELDGLEGFTKRKGQRFKFTPSSCFQRDGDLYIDADVLQLATGLRFKFFFLKMELQVDLDRKSTRLNSSH